MLFDQTPIYKGVDLETQSHIIPNQNERDSNTPEVLETHQKIESVLEQAAVQSEDIVKEARLQAASILNEAEEKRQLIETNAYQEGLKKGELQGQRALKKVTDYFQTILLEAQKEKVQTLKDMEPQVIDLILKMVQKILHIEPIVNEKVLIQVVRKGLEQLGKKVDVHIYVHPEDVPLLNFSLSQIQDLALDIVIEPDETIALGGCIIQSQAGNIDTQIDRQFEELTQEFLTLHTQSFPKEKSP